MNAGSLHDLINGLNLTETALKTVAIEVTSALNNIQSFFDTGFNALTPRQILLSKTGGIKLSLGISRLLEHNISQFTSDNFFKDTK